ncbi:MAG: hypothetical protein ACI837_000279 [Crocinitomicaceae bacterium]|jgi:hypothetical protein
MHTSNMQITQEIQLPEVKISLREDQIVHVYINPHTHITIELQTRLIDAYWSLVNDEHVFIFEGGEFVSISKEARENARLIEDKSPVSASAIVAHNLGQKILADYYYRFNKPKTPLKVFRSFDDGINWLKTLDEYTH